MDVRAQLLVEHSKANTQKITAYIGDAPDRIAELMNCFFSNEYRVTQRAAMAVSDCFDQNPELMRPYLKLLCQNLENEDLHIAVKRNTVRILQFIDIPEELQAPLFDRCLAFLMDAKMPIAVKAFSMGILYNICKGFPDLKAEVIPVIEQELTHTESAGVRSRAKNILKKLEAL